MSLSRKGVLITGANGFVGQYLGEELANNGYVITGLGGKGRKLYKPIYNHYFSLDLLEPKSLDKIDFSQVDFVIHLSGIASVGKSFDQPLEYIEANMGMEVNLFEAALKQNSFPKFLIISSGGVYGAANQLPLTESSVINPNSPYAVSKLGQENLAAYYGSRGFEYIIARPFNHIGPNQQPGYLIPDLLAQIKKAAKDNSKTIKVGNLSAKRDYTDVRDVVRAYRLLIESGKPNEIYNVCSGRAISGTAILEGLTRAAKVDLKPEVDNTKYRPTDILEIYGSFNKLKEDTGWKPQIKIEQTLEDIVKSCAG